MSKTFCRIAPGCSAAWICQANILREYRGLKAAKNLLRSVADGFPDEPVLPYNLACYACQLGNLGESCRWLLRAFEIENSIDLKLLALFDPDLKPLWEKILESLPLAADKTASAFRSSSAF